MTQNADTITDTQHSNDALGNGITAFVPTQDELIHLINCPYDVLWAPVGVKV